MGWERAIITDSGGFQVFSLAHGERRRRDQGPARRRRWPGERARDRRAGGALPLLPGRVRAVPRARRSRWRSRPRSAPTSRSPSTSARRTTPIATTRPARSSAPTAGSIAASTGTSARARAARPCSGSSRAASTRTCAAQSAERVSAAAVDGLAIGGTLGRDKEEMRGVVAMTAPHLAGRGAAAPARDRRARRPGRGDRARHRPVRLRGADPPRPARDGARPAARRALPLRRPPARSSRRTRRRWSRAARARPAPPTRRAYVHYLSRAEELTGVRLLVAPQPRLPGAPGRAAPGRRSGAARFGALPARRSSAASPPWACGALTPSAPDRRHWRGS